MYSPTSRLLTILELLQTRPVWGGAELAARLEVDVRTVRRYVMTLQDMGMPLESVHGPGGGYRLRPGFKLPPLLFTEEEATSIVISMLVTTARQVNLPSVSVEGALAKVLRVLPLRSRERLGQLTHGVTMAASADSPAVNAVQLLVLSDAVQQCARVAITYIANNGHTTERKVEPYGLAAWWGNWYLVGYCCLRHEMRTFRLDRIRGAAVVLGEPFTRIDGFDCQRFLAEHMERIGEKHAVAIRFDASFDLVRTRIPEHYGKLRRDPEGVIFETHYDDLGGLARFLITLNLPFVVLKPTTLKTELQTIAAQLMAGITGG